MTTSLDPERRAALLGGQLRALVAVQDPAAIEGAEVVPFAGGAGLRSPRATWALLHPGTDDTKRPSGPVVGLGAALAWATQGGTAPPGPVQVVVAGAAERRAGAIARQAGWFSSPPAVWRIAARAAVGAGRPARAAVGAGMPERTLVAVTAEAPPAPPEPPPAALALLDQLEAAGLEVIVEHGVVRGEIAGLEVAVVVVEDEAARIEVGVGRNDREAFALLHGDLPPSEAMARVADTVRQHRRPGAPPHPLNRMAPERWLRAHLLHDHERLAGWSVDPVPGLTARSGVADAGPAFAYGHDAEGRPVVLACSVGIDLELVPVAADTRAAIDPQARLVLAVPARDAHPVTERLAASLVEPAEVLAVDGEWR